MLLRFLVPWMLFFFFLLCFDSLSSSPNQAPYALRLSCGAAQNVVTKPTGTIWHKDFGYSGGISTNATHPSYITPPLQTLRYFPLSQGPQNCYNFDAVPKGHYSIRIFFGLIEQLGNSTEPLFDISIEGTQTHSLKPGWSTQDDQVFAEAIVFLTNDSISICFHSTGHGDPAILSIEILQIDDKAYYFVPGWNEGLCLELLRD
ncbi:Receptor-like protein 4 [Stylosanthes scabra]|uniref:Receptor-like protein 4 n=1 Tax=Stylosanthes scabra TaxID=79078 RepID=A0ABU6T8F8_9FABA|nr:Receptor-like protein 4 [Stylosanthes scabra]